MRIYFRFLALLFVCNSGFGVFSQTKDSSQILKQLVVTASKFPLKQDQIGKVLTVIGAEILEKNQGRTLPELLSSQTGLTILGAQNTYGFNQEVYLRGASTGNALILLNGIPLYDPAALNNAFDINQIVLEQIDRIEIVKGGQSTLYGSDAMSGVINIITKKNSNKPLSLTSTLAAGSYNTYKANIGLNGVINKATYNLQLSGLKSAGFSTAAAKLAGGSFDNDGFMSNNMLLTLGRPILSNLNMTAMVSLNKNKVDLDNGAFNDGLNYFAINNNLIAGFGFEYDLAKGIIHLNFSSNQSDRKYTQDSSKFEKNYVRSKYTGNFNFMEAYSNLSFNKNLDFLIGFDYRKQNMSSNYYSISEYGPYEAPVLINSQTNTSLSSGYASMVLKNAGIFGAEVGGRFNSHSFYGNNSTFSINPFVFVNEQFKVFINVSSAFKVPTQYQLFSEYGTAALKPTTSVTKEVGIQLFNKAKNANIRAVVFDSQFKDVIIFQNLNEAPYGKYLNFDKQRNKGIELEANYQASLVDFSINFINLQGNVTTLVNGLEQNSPNLFRIPKHTLNASLGINVTESWYVQASIKNVGKASSGPYDDPKVILGNYKLFNLYQEYKINKNKKLFLDAKNLGNVTYFDVPGYNNRRLNFMAGISFKI